MRTAWISLLVACSEQGLVPQRPDVHPGLVSECPFSAIDGTDFSVYDCNPVFTTTGEGWSSRVDAVAFRSTPVLGHAFYQIWYTARAPEQEVGYGLGYAVSSDGTSWQTHPRNPLVRSSPGSWDQDVMDNVQVLWDGEQYVMAWQGVTLPSAGDWGRWGLGVATSPDGLAWTPHPDNPVLDFLALDDGAVSPCWPLDLTTRADGYAGYLAAGRSTWAGSSDTCDVYLATSDDMAEWALSDAPVLAAGEWYDRAGIAAAAVVQLEGTWYLFYVGFERWIDYDGYQASDKHHLALATSPDGVHWTKHPDNPLPLALTEPGVISAVGAEVVGSRIQLWITDYYEALGTHAVGTYLFEP